MSTVKLTPDSGGGSVQLKAPASTSGANVILKLPQNDGDANQYLKTDGSGALSFATVDTSIADDSIAEVKLDISNTASNGQYLQYKDSTDKLTWQTVTTTTETAFTSCGTGATTEITGISSSAKLIKIIVHDVSFNQNSAKLRLRLGSSGGYKTSGYDTTASEGGGSTGGTHESDGFTQEYVGAGSYKMNFIWDLVHVNANLWNLKGMLNAGTGSEATHFFITGSVDLGATLTKLQFDSNNSSNFDDGDWKLYVTTLGA